MRRTERLFAMAEFLRGRRTGTTAEQLAERFGVTVRTAYRDLAALRNAELPLVAERGRGGGYALDPRYSLPPINLSAREAAVLLSAAQAMVEQRVLPFARTLAAAVDKVRGALSRSSQRELLARLDELQYVGVPARPVPADVRDALEQAWFERRPLEITYDGARGVTVRHVALEQVVMDRSETLLNCLDLDKQERRQFLLHRITRARALA